MQKYKVIDLFAGSGGLGEGFSAFESNGEHPFHIAISVEKDTFAHRTLRLRAYWRLLRRHGKGMKDLYAYYRGETDLPWTEETEDLWQAASSEAIQLELGKNKEADKERLHDRIASLVADNEPWVLIGGPPCQAYSVVGRVRTGEKNKDDPRHRLYVEYLNVIRQFRPAVFVMENVQGILSSKLDQEKVIHRILKDLSCPGPSERGFGNQNYHIHSLVENICYVPGMDPAWLDLKKFVVRCDRYGIPQARRRVILVGIREDIGSTLPKLQRCEPVPVKNVLADMPRLRSGLSREEDSQKAWKKLVAEEFANLAACAKAFKKYELEHALAAESLKVRSDKLTRGGQWIRGKYGQIPDNSGTLHAWLRDDSLGGWLNHETRSHIVGDLRRYAYAAVFARISKRNPLASKDFDLPELAPKHASWSKGFDDRFKVQLEDRPASTITSHIAKDGHAFIHPDPAQCRSLTVREAARIQTFPDNYFFEGPRTAQYIQVGNAVPPLLARQIAQCIWSVLQKEHSDTSTESINSKYTLLKLIYGT